MGTGVASSAAHGARIVVAGGQTFRSAYVRSRRGTATALEELFRLAARASGVTRYGRRHFRRAKRYAKLAKDLVHWSYDATLHLSDEKLGLRNHCVSLYGFLFACNVVLLAVPDRAGNGRDVGQLQTAPISVVLHSFRLIFRRAIISRNGLEREWFSLERARAEHPR